MKKEQQGQVVRASTHINFSKEAQRILEPVMAGVPFAAYQPTGKLRFELLATAKRQQLTLFQDDKPGTTVVFHPDRSVSLHDHKLKTTVSLPAQDLPRFRLKPTVVSKPEIREEGSRAIVDISLDDPVLGAVHHQFVFSRDPQLAEFGPALFFLMHCGPGCHAHSRFPVEVLAKQGCLIEERAWVAGHKEPLMEMRLHPELIDTPEGAFETPKGYSPLELFLKERRKEVPVPAEKPVPAPGMKEAVQAAVSHTALALKIDQKLSPECMSSTRFGSISAILHQDLLNHASVAVNTVAPLLGTATISGGTLTVPWLASLAGINAGSGTAPGSGIFCLLRDPRTTTAAGGPSGGEGLLDRIAARNLFEPDGNGLTLLERQFNDGTLAATLARWGVPAATAADLTTAAGNIRRLGIDDQIILVEAYETTDLGTYVLGGLPATLPANGRPYSWKGLLDISLTGIAGTVNFASLGGGPLITGATIGNAGNIVLTLAVPTITLTATVTRSLTGLGWLVLAGGTVAACALLPFLCPLMIVIAGVLAFVTNNVTAITVACTGITLGLDVQYHFNPSTNRVDPFVTVLSQTGTVTVTSRWVTPNLIANMFDSLVTSLGNLFNAWLGLLAPEVAKGVELGLRDAGLRLPAGQGAPALEADGGMATSNAGVSLVLSADITPLGSIAAQPFVTQVPTRDTVRQQLEFAHILMHRDLNPQPATPPPGPGPVTTIGTYLGVGASQNALNYYIFKLWRQAVFEATVDDPATIVRLLALVPPNTFVRQPHRIHLWCATPPRVEVSLDGIAQGTRPLVVFFDDVRACFEISKGTNEGTINAWELSFNLKTTGTVQLAWPWVFSLAVDDSRRTVSPSDLRTWEFVDPNVADIMGTLRPGDFEALVERLAAEFLRGISAAGIVAPPQPPAWNRRLVGMTQELLPSVAPSGLSPQSIYMEILGHRKTLYLLSAVRTALLELVDGSGAPTLNLLLGQPVGAVSLANMTCTEGKNLWWLLDAAGLDTFP